MAEEFVRALADMGPTAIWLGAAVLGLLAVCLLYLGIVLIAMLRTTEHDRQEYLYRVFHKLIDLIRDLCRCRGSRWDAATQNRAACPGNQPAARPNRAARPELKDQYYSLREIARRLYEEGLPTPMGLAQWSKSHVDRVLSTVYMQELSAESSYQPSPD